jgi:hypothetical protein
VGEHHVQAVLRPSLGRAGEGEQQHRAPVDQHKGVHVRDALLGALLLEEPDNGRHDGVAVLAADERPQDGLDGAPRRAVFVQRIGCEQQFEEGLQVGGGEGWSRRQVSLCVSSMRRTRANTHNRRQFGAARWPAPIFCASSSSS